MTPGLLSLLAIIGLGALSRIATSGWGGPQTRRSLGGAALAAALLMLLGRQIGLAVALGVMGATLLIGAGAGPFAGGAGGGRAQRGGGSTVRTAVLEMTLDHDSGAMEGRVLSGPLHGRALSSLSLEEALTLAAHVEESDTETLNLLRAWLDRTHPEWRDEADAAAEATPDDGTMSREEAYRVLGLEPGAAPEAIRAAHRRLMKRMHPDQGGSAALAAQINAARKTLLG